MLPYLEGHDTLAPANYPNLFKVANSRKRKLDGTFKDYKSNKESLAQLSDKEIDNAVAVPPFKKNLLCQVDFVGVQQLCNLSKEELTKVIESRSKAPTTEMDKFELVMNRLENMLDRKEKDKEES